MLMMCSFQLKAPRHLHNTCNESCSLSPYNIWLLFKKKSIVYPDASYLQTRSMHFIHKSTQMHVNVESIET